MSFSATPARASAARIRVERSAFADAAAAGVFDRVSTPSTMVALSGATSRFPSPLALIVGIGLREGSHCAATLVAAIVARAKTSGTRTGISVRCDDSLHHRPVRRATTDRARGLSGWVSLTHPTSQLT